MREILFRSWNKFDKKFIYFKEGLYNSDVNFKEGASPSYYFNWEHVEQFTGLLDKEGVRIFEGDKFAGDEPGEYYMISWNEEEAVFQANLYGYNVSYGEGSQEIYDDVVTCIDTNCFDLSALSSDVVIGNNFQ